MSPVSLNDCLCPVCLEIYLEPVTLPCTHTFCKACFLESVDKSTLCCPLCRKRVSTWARLHSRTNTLINQSLWTQIQTDFPTHIQRRVSGGGGEEGEEDADEQPVFFPRVSQPGEVRQEYEEQVTKLTEENRVMKMEEQRASEQLIKTLLEEEEETLRDEKKRREEENKRREEEDERMARELNTQLNSAGPQPITVQKRPEGQIDRFLSPRLPSSNFSSNKENIIVDLCSSSPEDQSQASFVAGGGACCVDQSQASSGAAVGGGACCADQSQQASTSKRGRRELEEPGSDCKKKICPSGTMEQGVWWSKEAELQRLKQEENDRTLALILQRELDQELLSNQRAADRRKGSTDAYPLRGHTHTHMAEDHGTTKMAAAQHNETTNMAASSSPTAAAASSSSSSSSSSPKLGTNTKTTNMAAKSPKPRSTSVSSSSKTTKTTKTTPKTTNMAAKSPGNSKGKQKTLTEMFKF